MSSTQFDLTSIRDIYPFTHHWMTVDGGHKLHYLDEGPKDAPVIVMLHGNPTWSFYYRNIIPVLSKSFRIIAPDHMGCGLSDKPQDYKYILENQIINLEALLSTLKVQHITLMMHDWGGLIGMGYAIRKPENISKFIILNTAAFYLPNIPLSLKIARSPIIGDIIVRGFNGFSRLALYFAMEQREKLTNQIKAGYLFPYHSWNSRVAVLRFIQDIPIEKKHISREVLDEIDKNINQFNTLPMLILWGDKDFVFTTRHFLKEWQKRFPEARVHVFKEAGHYVLEDAIEKITPLVLEFLNNNHAIPSS